MKNIIYSILAMKRNMRASRASLDRLQRRLLQNQIENAYRNVPFYHRLFSEQGLKPEDIQDTGDLHKLPVVNKKDIRKDPEAFLNRRLRRESSYRNHTSGSTGEPTWTYYDRLCWYRKKYISKLRARMACGLSWGQKIAIFESETTRRLRSQNRFSVIRNLSFLIQHFSIFEDVATNLPRLIRMRPENIYGPPSYLFLLARALREQNLQIPYLKRVFTSSEYLQKPIREFITSAFQADIFDVYGSTEMKEVAWECGHGVGYHINEDEIICEIVDDAGQPLKSSHPGHIVVTDLHNRAMPLIRFWVGDKGLKLRTNCNCGCAFDLMRPLAGRASDYIRLQDGALLSPFRVTTSIEKTRGLLQYQIVQETEKVLCLRVIFEDHYFEKGSHEMKQTLQELTAGKMTIRIDRCDRIDVETNGKFKVVKNLLHS